MNVRFVIICVALGSLVMLSMPTMATLEINGVQNINYQTPDLDSNPIVTYYSELFTGHISSEIFSKMGISSQNYVFASLAKAKDHFAVRNAVVYDMVHLASFGYSFGGNPGTAPTSGFQIMTAGAAADRIHGKVDFEQSNGVNASVAINGLKTCSTSSDCTTAISFVLHIAHLDTYGQAWIDNRIAAGQVKLWEHYDFFLEPATDGVMIPGDRVYMANPDDYEQKARDAHIVNTAYWTGENAIYVGRDYYQGAGIQALTKPLLKNALYVGYKHDTNQQTLTIQQVEGMSAGPQYQNKSALTFVIHDHIKIQ